MNAINVLFARLRYAWFVDRIEAEIEHRIFAQLNHEGDFGYPFDSHEELLKFCRDCQLDGLPFVQEIERDISRMPKSYGEAFRYILYHELVERGDMSRTRMRMYRMLAYRRVYRPENCDPRFVARRA